MHTSARWEAANLPKITVKSVYSAGGQSRPSLQGLARVVVGADDSVGPLGSCEFAEDYRKIGIFCRLIRSPDHDFCFRVADAFFGAVGGHEADADGHDPKPPEEHKNDQNDLRCGAQ